MSHITPEIIPATRYAIVPIPLPLSAILTPCLIWAFELIAALSFALPGIRPNAVETLVILVIHQQPVSTPPATASGIASTSPDTKDMPKRRQLCGLGHGGEPCVFGA